jgi:hypothetical protein
MAWEVAKGILIAAAVMFIGIPLVVVLALVIWSIFANSPAILSGLVYRLNVEIRAAMRRPAVLKLTSNSKGFVLPFTNGQATLVVGVFFVVVVVIIAIFLRANDIALY